MNETKQVYIVGMGMNAGNLWQALHKGGAQPLSSLQKATRLSDAQMHEALGWLGREGKIAVEVVKGKIAKVSLTEKA